MPLDMVGVRGVSDLAASQSVGVRAVDVHNCMGGPKAVNVRLKCPLGTARKVVQRPRRRSLLVCLAGTVIVFQGCHSGKAARSGRVSGIPMADLGPVVEIGAQEQGPPLAVFEYVVDAAILRHRVAVLDAAPPFVRYFTTTGTFVASAIPQGHGPAEMERPLGISRLPDEALLVNSNNKLLVVDSDGVVSQTITEYSRYIRGATAACDGIVRLVLRGDAYQPPGALTLARAGKPQEDTLVMLHRIRANSMRVHPFFAVGSDSTVLFYPEEIGENHLLLVHCWSHAVQEIGIDSLGKQEYFTPPVKGTFSLMPASPPRPAGIARIDGRVVWAVQSIQGSKDSVTEFDELGARGGRCRLAVEGWYEILDSTSAQIVLGAEAPVPRIILVPVVRFLAVMRRRGVAVAGAGKACSAVRTGAT